jgi:enoyl-CoA hydratase/carnithine racemase
VSADPRPVRLECDGRVAIVTLDRPSDQNCLTREVLLAFEAIVDKVAGDEEMQALVVTGAGSEFFSMLILNPLVRASYTKAQILELVRTANRLYDALEALPQIAIAAFNGAARAGEAELSLAGDSRVHREEERLGLVPCPLAGVGEARALSRFTGR